MLSTLIHLAENPFLSNKKHRFHRYSSPIPHLFHTIYFHPECNLLLSHFSSRVFLPYTAIIRCLNITLIVACLSITTGTYLLRLCLKVNVYSGSATAAFGPYVT
jgi:hypothetical protein